MSEIAQMSVAWRTVARPEGGTPIYRGIQAGHHAWDDALQGIARPGDPDGHADAVRHNAGDVRTSRFTSWSHSREIAERYAGVGGLLLEWRTGSPPPEVSWSLEWSPDLFYELEVLIRGTLNGARVIRL